MRIQPIKSITQEAFEKYGMVIELKPGSRDGWGIVVESPANGWRIAVLEFSRRATGRLEKHPSSMESFEPLAGTAVLLVAEESEPESFEAYLLDMPVCLRKGIWHEILSLSEVSRVKITENLEVECEYFTLPHEASICLTY